MEQALLTQLYEFDIAESAFSLSTSGEMLRGTDPSLTRVSFAEWKAKLHPDDRETVLSEWYNLVAATTQNIELHYRMQGEADAVSHVRHIGWRRSEAAGGRERIVGVFQYSVSDVHPDDLAYQVTSLQKEFNTFISIVSHDLKEPLRMITGYIQLLDRKGAADLPARVRDYIPFIIGGAEWMKRLIDDLIKYSRLTTRGKPFHMVDLRRIVAEAISDINILIKQTQAVISVSELPSVWGDEHQLRIVFRELIENAIKFRRTVAPHIQCSAEEEAEAITIVVEDNGIGIEERFYEKIFQIFQRLHPREQYEGTGIGLALCKKIIERHRGIIKVESQLGCGSKFFCSFPLPHESRSFEHHREERTEEVAMLSHEAR